YSKFSQLLHPLIKLNWHPQIEPDQHQQNSLSELTSISRKLADFSSQHLLNHQPFLVIGGDHSCAIGTWAGVINKLQPQQRFALLWIDAHLDAHTLKTSASGNLHGMPASAIIGQADKQLASSYPGEQFLKPEDLFYFGIRSYEADELALMTKHHANIVTMQDIQNSGGAEQCFKTLINHIDRNYSHFGISIDLDAIDPIQAPGVETPCANGLDAVQLMQSLQQYIPRKKLIGLEITEFNPQTDNNQITEQLVYKLINSIFSSAD
ncbi:MAG: arginase, partial [Gammaproteobacteria bacterium]|nr:arginase [Gammaproteobacteria bacterium]